MKRWLKLPLYTQIAIGGILGIILGFILGENAKYIAPLWMSEPRSAPAP